METWTRLIHNDDLPALTEIDAETFDDPWTLEDFKCVLQPMRSRGLVMFWEQEIVGYVIYDQIQPSYEIRTIVVAEEWRHQGVGTALIKAVLKRMRTCKRSFKHTHLLATVRDNDNRANCFFRSLGFKAAVVLRSRYGTGQDGILFSCHKNAVVTTD